VNSPRPLPVTLVPNRVQAAGMAALAAVPFAGGCWLAARGAAIGGLCAAFFALALAVLAGKLLPGSTWLTVDEDGIEFCTLFRRTRVPWRHIARFGVWAIPPFGLRKLVGFDYSEEYRKFGGMRGANRVLVGFEAALPDTYGMSAKDLAEMLAYHHAAHGGGAAAPPPAIRP
jgi:hypothetical protein